MKNVKRGIVVLFAAAFLLLPLTAMTISGKEGDRNSSAIENAKERLSEELLGKVDGVVGVGIGELENGEPCILVYLEYDSPELRERIPGRFDGFPVKIEVSGPILPYPKKPDAVIRGYVKDVKTGDPIAGASVSICGGFWILKEPNIYLSPERLGGYDWTTTDENGYYEMKFWSGESWVHVYAEGYREYSSQLTIAENEVKQYNIQLEPKPPKTAKVSGYVKDRDTGKPIPGAWVNLNNKEELDWSSAQTDEDGYFELTTYPGYCMIDVWVDAYYPYRTTLDLEENKGMTLDFSLKPRPGPDCVLYGRIVDASTGKPVEGALIYAWNEETYGYGEGRTDEDGRYEIKLIRGYHSMSVWAENYFQYSTVFEIGQGQRLELNVVLKPGGEPWIVYPMRQANAPEGWCPAPAPTDGDESAKLWFAIDQKADVTLTPERPVWALVVIPVVVALALAAATYWLRRRL